MNDRSEEIVQEAEEIIRQAREKWPTLGALISGHDIICASCGQYNVLQERMARDHGGVTVVLRTPEDAQRYLDTLKRCETCTHWCVCSPYIRATPCS